MARPSVFVGFENVSKVGEHYKVIEYKNAKEVTVCFSDGTIIVRAAKEILSGSIKNPNSLSVYGIGKFGQGEFKSKDQSTGKSKFTGQYQLWIGMLTRCYCESEIIKHPTYKDCYVCDEWLNYQKFAKWTTTQRFFNVADTSSDGRSMALDKDLLVPNNKVYSPDTCCFLPNKINCAIGGKLSGDKKLPSGVYWHKASNSYTSSIQVDGVQVHLGCFKDPEEAFKTFCTHKQQQIRSLADEYRDLLCDRAYQALLNYNISEREVYRIRR